MNCDFDVERDSHVNAELSVGIEGYLSEHSGFGGVIKQRWEDFHVHEVSPEGEILHLTELLSASELSRNIEARESLERGEGYIRENFTVEPAIAHELRTVYWFQEHDINTLQHFITSVAALKRRAQDTGGFQIGGCINESISSQPDLLTTLKTNETSEFTATVANETQNNGVALDQASGTSIPNDRVDVSHYHHQNFSWPPCCYIQGDVDQFLLVERTSDFGKNDPAEISDDKTQQVTCSLTAEQQKRVRKALHQGLQKHFPFLCAETVSEAATVGNSTLAVAKPKPPGSVLRVMLKDKALHFAFPRHIRRAVERAATGYKESANEMVERQYAESVNCACSKPVPSKALNTTTSTRQGRKRKRASTTQQRVCLACNKPIAAQRKAACQQVRWPRDRPPYLYFHMYKVNRDTAEAIQMVARCLRCSPKMFSFAGTKDRRAVTVQAVTAYHISIEQMHSAIINPQWDSSVKVSNLRYVKERLSLGCLQGNHFRICIRYVVAGAEPVIRTAVESLRDTGFVNFYGLQRFGTRNIKTYEIGAELLRERYRETVHLILGLTAVTPQATPITTTSPADHFTETTSSPSSSTKIIHSNKINGAVEADDSALLCANGKDGEQHSVCFEQEPCEVQNGVVDEAPPTKESGRELMCDSDQDAERESPEIKKLKCSNTNETPSLPAEGVIVKNWKQAFSVHNNVMLALKLLPKHLYLERQLLESLLRRPTDYLGALQTLPKNTLTLYIHAVQSVIWNQVASFRLKCFGKTPRVGDLIYATEDSKENDIEEDLYDDISAVSCSSLTATTEIDEETKQKEKLKPTPSSKATALARHRAAVVAVTEADLQRISIYDIVLPIPGTDVIYPDYLRSAYAEACRKYTGLELCDICSDKTKGLGEYSGGYRLFCLRPKDVEHRVVADAQNLILASDEVRLVNANATSGNTQNAEPLSLDLVQAKTDKSDSSEPSETFSEKCTAARAAVLLSCTLPKAAYLTVACRELLKR